MWQNEKKQKNRKRANTSSQRSTQTVKKVLTMSFKRKKKKGKCCVTTSSRQTCFHKPPGKSIQPVIQILIKYTRGHLLTAKTQSTKKRIICCVYCFLCVWSYAQRPCVCLTTSGPSCNESSTLWLSHGLRCIGIQPAVENQIMWLGPPKGN